MTKRKKQPNFQIVGDVGDLALSVLPQLSGLLTPEIVNNPIAVISSVGSAIVGNRLQKFYEEYSERKAAGKIRDDISSSADSFNKLLTIMRDSESDEQIVIAKKLFFKSIEPGTTDAEQRVLFNFMQICKQLDTNDLAVLKASYEIAKGKNPDALRGIDTNSRFRSNWFLAVSRHLEHNLASLVEKSEDRLASLKLITAVEERSPPTYFPAGTFRLTDLGMAFCEYLSS